jgi:hypothetical protein
MIDRLAGSMAGVVVRKHQDIIKTLHFKLWKSSCWLVVINQQFIGGCTSISHKVGGGTLIDVVLCGDNTYLNLCLNVGTQPESVGNVAIILGSRILASKVMDNDTRFSYI